MENYELGKVGLEVIKREVLEGEKGEEAKKKVQKTANKLLRAKQTKEINSNEETPSAIEEKSLSNGNAEQGATPDAEKFGAGELGR